MEDAVRAQQLMIGVPYGKWFDVCPGVRASFTEAGHILGSASVMLEATEDGRTTRSSSRATSAAAGCRSSAIPSRRPGRTW
jgi:Cft2 family RNA processing exonuclease